MNETENDHNEARRNFLRKTARTLVVTPPTVALILAASAQADKANAQYCAACGPVTPPPPPPRR
jgi:hypothetical protein